MEKVKRNAHFPHLLAVKTAHQGMGGFMNKYLDEHINNNQGIQKIKRLFKCVIHLYGRGIF
jgi:hypothetical protein